jgi:hypothetical protein
MAETLTSTIQSFLDRYKLGNPDFVNEIVGAVTSEKLTLIVELFWMILVSSCLIRRISKLGLVLTKYAKTMV